MANLLTLVVLLESLCALCLCCSYGDLRLRDGRNSSEGRMEVCFNSVWGSVCHDRLDRDGTKGMRASTVACRQLGFSDQGAILERGPHDEEYGGRFGPGTTGTVHLDELKCAGNESALIDCPHIGTHTGTHDCTDNHAAGVICMPSECPTEGGVRLVGGTGTEGRVEVCQGQTWYTVSADGWGVEEARVVCRQLGMSVQGASPMPGTTYGEGAGPIMTTSCTGSESTLVLCAVTVSGHNYNHSSDAGVTCSASEVQTVELTTQPNPTTLTATTVTTTVQPETTTVAMTTHPRETTQPDTTTTTPTTVAMTTRPMQTTQQPDTTTNAPTTVAMTTRPRETTHSDITSDELTTIAMTTRPSAPPSIPGQTESTLGTTGSQGNDHTGMHSTDEHTHSLTSEMTTPPAALTTTDADSEGNELQWWAIGATVTLGLVVLVLVGVVIVWACCYAKKRRRKMNLMRRTRSTNYVDTNIAHTNTLEVSLHQCDAYEIPNNLNSSSITLTKCQAYRPGGKSPNLDDDSGIIMQSCSAYGNNELLSQQRTREDEIVYDSIHDYDYMYSPVSFGRSNN